MPLGVIDARQRCRQVGRDGGNHFAKKKCPHGTASRLLGGGSGPAQSRLRGLVARPPVL